MNKLTQVYFSPGGTTHQTIQLFSSEFELSESLDLLKNDLREERTFTPHDLVVIALPVFAGRIPSVCPEVLQRLKGQNTPAVIMVTYGNREYEDALLELGDIMEKNGFIVISAGAFVARHSIFPQVAHGRPDEDDVQKIKAFALTCKTKIQEGNITPVVIKGNRPYRDISSIPLKPSAKSSTCTKCGVCIKICPVQAIPENNPAKTDKKKCISCAACVYHCPVQSRSFGGFLYKLAGKIFANKCAARKEPDIF